MRPPNNYRLSDHAHSRTCALWVGDSNTAATVRAFDVVARQTDCHLADDITAALALLKSGDVMPTPVVVVQRYPGQIAHAELDRLARLAPLAGFVEMACVWCEGDGRSGRPWPAARQIYWSRSEAYFREQLRRVAAGQTPDWALPATATTDEYHLLAADVTATGSQRGGATIVIQSDDRDMRDWLTTALYADGFAAIGRTHADQEPIRGAAAAVIDWPVLTKGDVTALKKHVTALSPARAIVLVDFPRPEMIEWLTDAGASGLLTRPLEIAELTGQLWHLVEPDIAVDSPPERLSLAG